MCLIAKKTPQAQLSPPGVITATFIFTSDSFPPSHIVSKWHAVHSCYLMEKLFPKI